jgi:tRNA(fMet)-specific endonuclease VapC
MIILDTDHLSALQHRPIASVFTLQARLEALSPDDIAITAITVEEQMRGWMAHIHRYSDVHRQVASYERLIKLFDFYAQWQILPFDHSAADAFKRLRNQGVRIGTMDLKIASIVLVTGGTLLSGNDRDFQHVPGIRVENWLQS